MIAVPKILIIQNDPTVPPGVITRWFHRFDLIQSFQEKIPRLSDYDLVIICGGEPNTHEEDIYPWLVNLKIELKYSINNSSTKIIGLCLGGQLCAEALGSKVYRHPNGLKVGWESVTLEGKNTDLMFFHYHQYIFDLPKEAHRIASNQWWQNQGFLWKNRVLAVQFHPEAEEFWIRECLENQIPTAQQLQWMNESHAWLKNQIDSLLKA